jgi:penicillin-binding protein 2
MKTERIGGITITAFAVAVLFTVLAARLWQLQVVRGREFERLSFENRLRMEKVPSPRGIIYDRNGRPLVKNSPYYSVALIPEMTGSADIEGIADFLSMDAGELHRIIGSWEDPLELIRLRDGLSFEEVAYLEARLSDYPALTIDVQQTRHYLYGDVGSHLIGYLGKLNPRQTRKKAFKDVPRQALIGQWGVEKLYDSVLRGTPGKRVIEVDALGRRLRKISEEPPVRGADVYLSVDINLQKIAEAAFGNRVGAMVALKPDTGELLGLVSRPSFDPNLFSRGIEYRDWIRLSQSKRYPMLNRALQSQYPPGSTFKIITAIAALETGAITPKTRVTCTGQITHGRWTFGCWKKGGHGKLSLYRALVESCDVYFYTAGGKTGIDSIAEYARALGLGTEAGVGLVREKRGLIPDTEWKRRVKNESWYPGETYNASIGQGFVLTTPVQLARMMSAVSNGGYLNDIKLTMAEGPPDEGRRVKLKEETVKAVKDALRGVVSERKGTAHFGARSKTAEISGKTGTSQVISSRGRDVDEKDLPLKFRDHAWFVAYAPRDEPEIALSVFVEHGGHGGAAAAPIAKAAIEAYMSSPEWGRTGQEANIVD